MARVFFFLLLCHPTVQSEVTTSSFFPSLARAVNPYSVCSVSHGSLSSLFPLRETLKPRLRGVFLRTFINTLHTPYFFYPPLSFPPDPLSESSTSGDFSTAPPLFSSCAVSRPFSSRERAMAATDGPSISRGTLPFPSPEELVEGVAHSIDPNLRNPASTSPLQSRRYRAFISIFFQQPPPPPPLPPPPPPPKRELKVYLPLPPSK